MLRASFAAALLLTLTASRAAEPPARTDVYGDPLPEGARVRMGTIQFHHPGASVAFSADGKALISCGSDGVVRRWDLATGKKAGQKVLWRSAKEVESFQSILIAPTGEMAAARRDQTVYLYRVDSGEEIGRLALGSLANAWLRFSRDGKFLTAKGEEKARSKVQVWDVAARKKRCELSPEDSVTSVALSPDGKTVATSTFQNGLILWDAATGKKRRTFKEIGWYAGYSPAGKILAGIAVEHSSVRLWNAADGTEWAKLPLPKDLAHHLVHFVFSPDGTRLAGVGQPGLIVWDVATRKVLRQLPERKLIAAAFAPDGRTLACWGGFGNEIRLWDIATGKRLHDRPGHGYGVDVLAVSPDGKFVVSGTMNDPALHLWDAATGRPIRRMVGSDEGFGACVFSSDGKRLAAASRDGTLRLWETATGALIHQWKAPSEMQGSLLNLRNLRFTAEGGQLATIVINYERPEATKIYFWDTKTGKIARSRAYKINYHSRFTPDGGTHTRFEIHAALSADAESVTVRIGKHLAIEDARTSQLLTLLPENVGQPVAFSPDGQLVAASIHKPKADPFDGYDMEGVCLIEAATGREVFRMKTGQGRLLAFSPEGHLLATVDDEAIHVWDVATGEECSRRVWADEIKDRGKYSPAWSLAFLPGERGIVTGMNDGAVLVWDLQAAAKRPAKKLGTEALNALWSDLAAEPRAAHRALHVLAADPERAVPFLQDHCRPAETIDAKRYAPLFDDLNSERFTVRQRATRELTRLRDRIEPALRRRLKENPSLEARKRLESILATARPLPDAKELRTLRAIRTLERIGTPEARGILRKLADGAKRARETVAAKKALERLAMRPSPARRSERKKEPRKDFYGDPLPLGALVRMGSVQLRHHDAKIAFAADGKSVISAGWGGQVRFWNLAAGRISRQTSIPNVSISSLSPDGKIVAAFSEKGLSLCDTATGKERHRLPVNIRGHQTPVFSADGKWLAAVTGDSENDAVRLWDVATGKERLVRDRLRQHGSPILSPDGKLLGYWDADFGDQVLRLWDAATGRELCKKRVEGRCWAISPDGKTFATADHEGVVTLRDTAHLKIIGTLKPVSPLIDRTALNSQLAFSPDGVLLAVGGLEKLVLWDVAARKERRRLDDREARELAFAPDGKTLACAGNFEIRLWDAASGKRLRDRPGHDTSVRSVAVSPDGKTVASIAGLNPAVRLWDAATGKPRPLTPKLDSWLRELTFASDGRLLVCGGRGVLHLLDGESGKESRRFVVQDLKSGKQNHEIVATHLSADDKQLSAISISRTRGENLRQMTVWNVRTGERLACRLCRSDTDDGFAPDGAFVTVRRPKRLILEDPRIGRELGSIPGDLGRPVAFSPDGGLLAVGIYKTVTPPFPGAPEGYEAMGVRVVETASGQEIFHVEGWIDFADFSPDGRLLVTADPKSLRLWDVATGKRLLERTWPEGEEFLHGPMMTPLYSLAFLPDGRSLVTGMNNGTLLVWDLTHEALPQPARRLDRPECAALWASLAGEARAAHRAAHTLAASPAEALSLLAEQLRPVAVVDAKRVGKRLSDLDSERFAVRDAAAKELTAMGEQIEPALQRVLENKPSLEVRNRVQTILDLLHGVPSAAVLRTLRAIRVLEYIATPEARKQLEKLADGAASARETRAAKKAIERLANRVKSRR